MFNNRVETTMKTYRIKDNDGEVLVLATSFGQALAVWRRWLEVVHDIPSDEALEMEPETIERLDFDAVIGSLEGMTILGAPIGSERPSGTVVL
jgi:hypothetical protein